MAPSPTAGKSNPKTPTKLARKPQQLATSTAKSARDTTETVVEPGQVEMNDPGEAGDDVGKISGELEEQEPKPIEDVVEETHGAKKIGSGLVGGAKSLASRGAGAVGSVVKGDSNGAVNEAQQGAEDAGETAQGAVQNAKETGEDVTGQELPEIHLSVLKGLEVDDQGLIHDDSGKTIGRLAEGDAEDLAGYTIGDDGEILDDDGDLVGRCEILPEAAQEMVSDPKREAEGAAGNLPGLEILKGLGCDATGNILNEDGDTIGQLVHGNPSELRGRLFNANGEILDDDGNVIGRAKVHPDAAKLYETAEEGVKGAEDQVNSVVGQAGEGAERAVDEAGEAIDGAVDPGIEALEGRKVNEADGVVDQDGNVLAQLVEGDADKLKGTTINDKGEVINEDGNVVGKVELADGAEKILDAVSPDLRILEGLKVNKKGKALDREGEVLGELVDGDPADCAGKKVNDKGEVLDKGGKVIGRVKVVPGEAATEALKELQERLDEVEEGTLLPGLDILDGLKVNKRGKILNEDGDPVGELVNGELSECAGKKCNDKGEVLDKNGRVIGRVKTLPQQLEEGTEEGEEPEPEAVDFSILAGRTVNKQGNVIGDKGVPIGRLVEGNPKELSGKKIDSNGQIWNDQGQVVGRCELIPENEREAKPEGPFAGLQGLRVIADGLIADEDENVVGTIVEGNAKRLVGLEVDEDGDIVDRYGNVKGHAEPIEEEEEVPTDYSILNGKVLNKQGFVTGDDGIPIGRLVEGNAKDLAGRRCDEHGQIHNDTGKVVGRCDVIPENERAAKAEGPFAGYEGLRVVKDGKVEDEDGNVVGVMVEGNPKRLIGRAVDEDGDIVDKYGNVKGHAEPFEEEEAPEADLSALAGCTVNKAGNVVDNSGAIIGRVAQGDLKNLVGRKVDGQGQIWDNSGKVIGRAELAEGADQGPEGAFGGFENITVAKDGTVQTPDGTIVGRITEGDVKKLVGHKVDEDGEISDKNGNTIGKAERWEPEKKERRINPMSGRRVNKEGEVRDENGDLMGRLTAGNLGRCAGLEIDDNGYVIDNDGNKIGEVTLLENIQEESDEKLTEEEQKKKNDAELADKMANICQQTIERIQPVLKQITEHTEQADRTPRDELDEEELVNNVKPLIEEASRILQECNGSLRALDPDGRIAAQAKGRAATREATPEEYRLADLLKELTNNVVTTIDSAKKKISNMPHAKKKLNPMWVLLTEPLFQIIAAVGLLLSGVLGLVGRLLSGLGLDGLVNALLGGLGIDKLLYGLGLGPLSEGLFGKKEKKGSGSGLPLVGGLFGGGK